MTKAKTKTTKPKGVTGHMYLPAMVKERAAMYEARKQALSKPDNFVGYIPDRLCTGAERRPLITSLHTPPVPTRPGADDHKKYRSRGIDA